jgi:hypothetical protein
LQIENQNVIFDFKKNLIDPKNRRKHIMKMHKFLTSVLAVTLMSGVIHADDSTGSVATSATSSESILAKLEKSPLDLFLYTDHSIDTNTLESNEESEESKGNTIGAYNSLYMGRLS